MFDLKKFADNPALITENKIVSYRELSEIANKIGDAINRRCLIFFLATNSVDSIAGYIGMINKKIVPVMIDSELDFDSLKNLVEIYQPDFIFLPQNLRENFSDCEEILSTEKYSLLSSGKKISIRSMKIWRC